MNAKRKNFFTCVLVAAFAVCFAVSVITLSNRGKTAYATGEDITSTKFMISSGGDYILFATAFRLSLLEGGAEYAFGYKVRVNDSEDPTDYYSNLYYEGITVKTGATTRDWTPEQIFGEGYSFSDGYALIIEEIPYVPGNTYDYQVYYQKSGESENYGSMYEGLQKFSVTFDSDGGTAVANQFVNVGAKSVEPTDPTKDGYNFIGWKNGGDDFDFDSTITGNVTLTAQWKQRPTLSLADEHSYMIDQYNDVGYAVTLNDYTAGELVLKNGETTLTAGDDYYYDGENGKLVMKAAYLNDIYRFGTTSYTLDLNGTEFAVGYENAANRILNGGFDRGTIYGWNAYKIWKNEYGMLAWTNDRVVNGTYFDGKYSYNRDGNYNLGIYGGSISKDSGQERMGHLRSSDFVLGGTGWVSFKLGGGKKSQFAYLSVRKTSDNTEVARFGNRHFGNKTLSGTDNAEAYMFQYYYDLSSYLGQSLYFMISDTASHDWCVLSADSFFTYYAEVPSTTGDTLAENIVPTLANSENAATNEILGSNDFTSDNLTNYWTMDGTGWGFDDGDKAVKSNKVNGDGGYGILRSAAFTISGNPCVQFDWGGGLKHDKQIFVSVKEVGTNIEVKRFVVRSDKSNKEDNDYSKHIFDLSDLSAEKTYYLEFADNRESSWGVSYVRKVVLISASDYSSQDTKYRATSISGIVTDYTYADPY